MKHRIGFGGGCHWCTEAVFQSLEGVDIVEQGWIASVSPNESYSEAVIVHYSTIDLPTLIEVHLLTHSSTKEHSMREKYRSAIYYFNEADKALIEEILANLSEDHEQRYITTVLPFVAFKLNKEEQLNYYQRNKEAPFCTTYIHPKLAKIREKFGRQLKKDF